MNIRKFLKQKAVYWAPGTLDGFGGMTFLDPVEIPVRWTDVQKLFVNYEGVEVLSRSKLMVDQDLEVKGMISLMDLVDISSNQSPFDNNAFEVKAFMKMPDVKARQYVRMVWL